MSTGDVSVTVGITEDHVIISSDDRLFLHSYSEIICIKKSNFGLLVLELNDFLF